MPQAVAEWGMSQATDLFHGLRDRIERDPAARELFERRVASRDLVLDVGGRNQTSRSARRLASLGSNPRTRIVCTDVAPDYGPDLVDDIADSQLPDESYDGIYCVSILEHVADSNRAAAHLHRILRQGGEIVLYVPFVYPFHDRSDHHRFTFTEVARLMAPYAEFRICLADGTGYGGVLLDVLSFHQAHRLHRTWIAAAAVVNALLALPLAAAWVWLRRQPRWTGVSWRDFRFYFTHLHLAHGFWAWGRK